MVNFSEQPQGGAVHDPDARRLASLERQQTEWTEELRGVEDEIKNIEDLQAMVKQHRTDQELIQKFDGDEATQAMVKAEEAIVALVALDAAQDLNQLFERRRQLKQLLQTGKMDLEAKSANE